MKVVLNIFFVLYICVIYRKTTIKTTAYLAPTYLFSGIVYLFILWPKIENFQLWANIFILNNSMAANC